MNPSFNIAYKNSRLIFISINLGFREELSNIRHGQLALTRDKALLVEQELGDLGCRRVNIDPGYITGHNLVLATTKERPHRVYIGQGIYAEVTMAFKKGRCEFFPWTYRDYREKGCEFFLGLREPLKKV